MADSPSNGPPNGHPNGANRRWRRLTPLLLLVSGFAAGVVASQILESRRSHDRSRHRDNRATSDRGDRGDDSERGRGRRGAGLREHLQEELGLDEEQQAQLDAFLEANRSEARAFWDDARTGYRELRERFRDQIRGILTEEQRAAFDRLVDDRSRGDGGSGRGGGAGRPLPPEVREVR